MIVNLDMYNCIDCKEILEFDTSKNYERKCTKCGSTSLKFIINFDADTDLIGKKAPDMQPEQYFEYLRNKDKVQCPYCKSFDIKKISTGSRIVSTGLFGLGSSKIGKQWHCNSCKSDF